VRVGVEPNQCQHNNHEENAECTRSDGRLAIGTPAACFLGPRRRDGETVSPTQAKQYPTLARNSRARPPPPRPHPQLVCLHTSTHGPSLLLNTLHPDRTHPPPLGRHIMDDFNSETDSDYTSYWRDWVGTSIHSTCPPLHVPPILELAISSMCCWVHPMGKRLIAAWYVCTICIMKEGYC
jgi:hypothetical protein